MIDDMIAVGGKQWGRKQGERGVYIEINYNFDYN